MSGLRCPHHAARLWRRLHSATAAPAPPRCIRRRRRSAPQPSTKFHGKSRTRRFAPRTQFAAKFPCRCRRRRRMSADGDDFRLFRQSAARPPVFHGWAYFLCTFRTIEMQNFRKSLANSVETLGQNRYNRDNHTTSAAAARRARRPLSRPSRPDRKSVV